MRVCDTIYHSQLVLRGSAVDRSVSYLNDAKKTFRDRRCATCALISLRCLIDLKSRLYEEIKFAALNLQPNEFYVSSNCISHKREMSCVTIFYSLFVYVAITNFPSYLIINNRLRPLNILTSNQDRIIISRLIVDQSFGRRKQIFYV